MDNPGKATTTKTTFRLECQVGITINASREKVWSILTDAGNYSKWNSTILSAEGDISLDQVIKLKTTLDPVRTFKLRVTEFSPPSRMVWADGVSPFFRGTRTFTLTQRSDGGTDFRRVDVYAGLLFPLVAGALPDFNSVFEILAAELKAEAEKSLES